MIKATGDDYVYRNADRLFITNKDGLLCFLKDQLGGLVEDVRNDVFKYINVAENSELNTLGLKDLLSAYMLLDEEEPTGEFYVTALKHVGDYMQLSVIARDIYLLNDKWYELAPYLEGWIEWIDTTDNSKFRFVFENGYMTAESPVFPSDMKKWPTKAQINAKSA